MANYIYSLTNEKNNKIEVYIQNQDGTLSLRERVETKGEGGVDFNSFRGTHNSAPLLSDYEISINDDYIFVLNIGDNSVSSFKILEDDSLEFIDNKKTKAPGANSLSSLAFNKSKSLLYASHFYGGYIAVFKAIDGTLQLLDNSIDINITDTVRYAPSILLSPDNKFIISHIFVDDDIKVVGPKPSSEKNLCVIELDSNGLFKSKKFYDISVGNFASYFIDKDKFILSSALNNEINLIQILENGTINVISSVIFEKFSHATPGEACWIAYDEYSKTAYITNTGYGTIISVKVVDDKLKILNNVEFYATGTGKKIGLGGLKTSSPIHTIAFNDYLYTIFNDLENIYVHKILQNGELEYKYKIPVTPYQFGLTSNVR